jgi:glycosyltransferase involved in cell wall biosynthesis
MARHVDHFLANVKRLTRVVTASRSVEQRLLDWGVERCQVARVPLGVDTTLFRPPDADQRLAARAKWGVPKDAICIGSFQKDGVGWGSGLEPKLIKGPDVFVNAVARLARDFPVFVLLTGPARGYVIKGLESHEIPFRHVIFDDYRDIVGCYHALDLYLVTSREEGGPKALLESMATGVPLVATRTGMAEDVVEDGVNGHLVPVDDVETIVNRAQSLLSDGADDFAARGRVTAEAYDWSIVSEILYDTVYRELLA